MLMDVLYMRTSSLPFILIATRWSNGCYIAEIYICYLPNVNVRDALYGQMVCIVQYIIYSIIRKRVTLLHVRTTHKPPNGANYAVYLIENIPVNQIKRFPSS